MRRTRGARRTALGLLAGLSLGLSSGAPGQVFLYQPNFRPGPIEPGDPLVGVPIPGATVAENRAHLIWNMRSGLNVAALQCQFSPFLRAVDNYNAILAHHSAELAAAYTALEGYFRRTGGRNGPRRFDDYSTQTYNNFSTYQAQLGFCQTAARIARDALTRRQGEFHILAAERLRELRNSQTVAIDQLTFTRLPVRTMPLNLTPVDCSRLPRSERRQCEQANRR